MPAADAGAAGDRGIRRPVHEPARRRPRRPDPARPADRAVRDRRPAERDAPRLAVRGARRRRRDPPAPGELDGRLPEHDRHRHRRGPERARPSRSRIRPGSIRGSRARRSASPTPAARRSTSSAAATGAPAEAEPARAARHPPPRAARRSVALAQAVIAAELGLRIERPPPRTTGSPRGGRRGRRPSARRDTTADRSGGAPAGRARGPRSTRSWSMNVVSRIPSRVGQGRRGRRLELEDRAVDRVLGRRQRPAAHRLGEQPADRLVEREDVEQERRLERIRSRRHATARR